MRRRPISCGVDVGSTNIKVVGLADDGRVVARSRHPTPRDAETLWIDADELQVLIEQMIIAVCGVDYEVHALSTAGVGEDGVLVDAGLRPLTPALAWFDPRRQSIFRALRPQLVDDLIFDAETDPVRTIVGWAWARDQPGAESAAHWLALADVVGVRFSGHPFLSDTLASRTAAWRSKDRKWVDARVELTLGRLDLLPPVVATGELVGTVRSAALEAAGVLAADAIVVAGGHDHPIGGWGVDQMAPGAVLDSMGTAEVVVVQSPVAGVSRHDHIDVAPGIRSSGTTLLRVEELARNVAWASQDPAVAAHIRSLLDGSAKPLPVLDSGYFLPGRRGGGQPSYSLDAPQSVAARASAVLGALAISGRDAVDAVAGDVRRRGSVPVEVRLAGGWAQSPGWVDIKSSVNGYRSASIPEPDVTAVATALLAARARGWTPSSRAAFSSPSSS